MNNTLTPQTIIQRKEDQLLVTTLGDELVMMDTENGNYISINNIGRTIWEKIEQPIAVKELIEFLLNKYNVAEDQCTAETFSFLEKLNEQHLIQ